MKLSLITINYNDASGLEKTILSVLTQKNLKPESFEYIIVDGASKDGSLEIIKKYADSSEYPQKISKWISEKDTGIYNAINKGIKLATGDVIGLLNSGDTALPDAYDDVLDYHSKNPDAIIYGGMNMCRNGVFENVYAFSAEDLGKQMISHPGSFVPKSVYEKYGCYDEKLRSSADWDLYIHFKKQNVPFIYTSKIYLDFDMGGISNSNVKLVIKEDTYIKRKYKLITRKEKLKKIYSILNLFIPGIITLPIKMLAKQLLRNKIN